MSKAPKTTDGLMRHLRSKGIQIGGSIQKRKLMNMGYYHGYKGCRYIKTASNRIPFSSFDEVIAIYEFDSQLKSLFYPYIMQIETILKNYELETVVNSAKSDDFYNIYIIRFLITISNIVKMIQSLKKNCQFDLRLEMKYIKFKQRGINLIMLLLNIF